MPVRSDSTESQRSGLNRRPRGYICESECGASAVSEGNGAADVGARPPRPTPFALEVPNERPTAVSAVAALLHFLATAVRLALVASPRDAVYADGRCLVAWRWLA
jgi:hypothetical protein